MPADSRESCRVYNCSEGISHIFTAYKLMFKIDIRSVLQAPDVGLSSGPDFSSAQLVRIKLTVSQAIVQGVFFSLGLPLKIKVWKTQVRRGRCILDVLDTPNLA